MSNSKRNIFLLASTIILLLILDFFIGFPMGHIKYFKSYGADNFPYKICSDKEACVLKSGELFVHEWFLTEYQECRKVASAGGYNANYRYSDNIERLNQEARKRIERPTADNIFFSIIDYLDNCRIISYTVFKAGDTGEAFFSRDYFIAGEKNLTSTEKLKIIILE